MARGTPARILLDAGASVELLRRQLFETPPTNPHRQRDMWSTFKLGRHFPELDAAVQRDIHELFKRSARDLLDHWFETDAVKALYGFDTVIGNNASPYTPAETMCCCTKHNSRA